MTCGRFCIALAAFLSFPLAASAQDALKIECEIASDFDPVRGPAHIINHTREFMEFGGVTFRA
ncbi:MAG: hypothetical protein WA268_12495 [Xanthobacteraceae bacterium]